MVNVIRYPTAKLPGQTVWQYLKTGWKFPFMATMIVGISTHLTVACANGSKARIANCSRK